MSGDLQPMAVSRGSLAAHSVAAGDEAVERVRAAAEPLRGARVLHVSSAGPASRVPELLSAAVPLALDAGVDVEWRVLFGDDDVSGTAVALANGLQGAEAALDEETFEAYLDTCARVGRSVEGEAFDLVVLHDPGTLGLAGAVGRAAWRCHLDCSEPDPEALEHVVPLTESCDAVAFPDPSFAPWAAARDDLHAVPPGIDPLSSRNLEISPRIAGRMVRPLGVDLGRPFVLQTMRLDRWKDPHATVEAFRLAREELPDLQLVLASSLEARDVDGWRALHELTDYSADTPGVLSLTSYEGLGGIELGSLERLARATVQRSLREGFGLAASEALWKGTPVIGGPDGGLPLQVRHGVDGYLVRDAGEVAARIVELVNDPGLAIEMGARGQQRVRERFLVTRMLEDELAFLGAALAGATVGPA